MSCGFHEFLLSWAAASPKQAFTLVNYNHKTFIAQATDLFCTRLHWPNLWVYKKIGRQVFQHFSFNKKIFDTSRINSLVLDTNSCWAVLDFLSLLNVHLVRWLKPGNANRAGRLSTVDLLQGIRKYHCTIDLLFEWFGISCMTTDKFCFYLQDRLI